MGLRTQMYGRRSVSVANFRKGSPGLPPTRGLQWMPSRVHWDPQLLGSKARFLMQDPLSNSPAFIALESTVLHPNAHRYCINFLVVVREQQCWGTTMWHATGTLGMASEVFVGWETLSKSVWWGRQPVLLLHLTYALFRACQGLRQKRVSLLPFLPATEK